MLSCTICAAKCLHVRVCNYCARDAGVWSFDLLKYKHTLVRLYVCTRRFDSTQERRVTSHHLRMKQVEVTSPHRRHARGTRRESTQGCHAHDRRVVPKQRVDEREHSVNLVLIKHTGRHFEEKLQSRQLCCGRRKAPHARRDQRTHNHKAVSVGAELGAKCLGNLWELRPVRAGRI